MRAAFRPVAVLVILASCAETDAPTVLPPEREMQPYGAAITETFSAVSGGVFFGDTLFVADRLENKVVAIDLGDGSAKYVGGEGSGPGEFRTPSAILQWPGDSVVVWDGQTRAFSVWSKSLSFGRTFRIEHAAAATPFGSTQDGRLFAAIEQHRSRSPGVTSRVDSVVIVRLGTGTPAIDTLAFASIGRRRALTNASSDGTDVSSFFVDEPFSETDVWGAFSGRVIIARSEPFRLEIVSDRTTATGPVLPNPQVAVTAADRAPWEKRKLGDPWNWPAYKPPFPRQSLIAGGGLAYLEVSAPAGSRMYFALDSLGNTVFRFSVDGNMELIAARENVVAFTERDDTNLLHLRVFRF